MFVKLKKLIRSMGFINYYFLGLSIFYLIFRLNKLNIS